MTEREMSRRRILGVGACALAAASGVPQMAYAHAEASFSSNSQETIRDYYSAWEKKDWQRLDLLLADDFTFSSPLDDHISKGDYKVGCWNTQSAYIDRFDLKQVMATENEAFVMYICHTANGKIFQNVEYFQFRGARVMAVECYFGGKASFPSAVSAGKG